MTNKLRTAIACGIAATTLGVGALATDASAAEIDRKGPIQCVKAGVKTLISLGLLDDAARREVDYSTLADPVNGPIFADLPEGSFLSLGQVIRLHVTNPELFAWCR